MTRPLSEEDGMAVRYHQSGHIIVDSPETLAQAIVDTLNAAPDDVTPMLHVSVSRDEGGALSGTVYLDWHELDG